MSHSLDVNVLVYASSQSSPFHSQARDCVETLATGSDLFCLAWPTVTAYLRMVTHAAILSPPLSQADAEENVDRLIRLPNVRLLAEEDGFWELYRDSTRGMVITGKMVPDAHLAVLMRQHGVRTLYTNDHDFLKFDFLDVRNPFQRR